MKKNATDEFTLIRTMDYPTWRSWLYDGESKIWRDIALFALDMSMIDEQLCYLSDGSWVEAGRVKLSAEYIENTAFLSAEYAYDILEAFERAGYFEIQWVRGCRPPKKFIMPVHSTRQ